MPIIKKVVEIGNSRAIFLPKTWLQYYESQIGQEIKLVAVEVDKKLEIEPYIPQKPLKALDEEEGKTRSKARKPENPRLEV